jgi:hypothetical protein
MHTNSPDLSGAQWGGFYHAVYASRVDVVDQSRDQEVAAMERLQDHLDVGAPLSPAVVALLKTQKAAQAAGPAARGQSMD